MHLCTLHNLANVYLMHLEAFIEPRHVENMNERELITMYREERVSGAAATLCNKFCFANGDKTRNK